jgi:hypothetical protein
MMASFFVLLATGAKLASAILIRQEFHRACNVEYLLGRPHLE